MKLSKQEQETVALWNEANAYAEIYTYTPALQNQLSEPCQNFPEQVRRMQVGSFGSMTFELPKKWLKVSPPRKPTPAQLEVLARMNQKRHGGG